MKALHATKQSSLTVALAVMASFGFTAIASATAAARPVTPDQQLKAIITAGDSKIAKRFEDLDKLTAKITATSKLSSTSKASLTAEIASAKTGLTSLKTKLDADTTVDQAKTDSKLIYTDYRVYMLVVPKVGLAKVADNQLTKEDRLMSFATLLKDKVASSNQSATLMPKVTDMIAKIDASKTLSQGVLTKLLPLKPSDYNANHELMKGYLGDLQKAQASNVAAYKEGTDILTALGTAN